MQLWWNNSGNPPHKFKTQPATGFCACCGFPVTEGAAVADVVGTAFSRQSEFMPHGTHVCHACAWMCSDAKVTHRNVIAAGDKIWWPMIGHDSATAERPSWLDVLRIVVDMPGDAPAIGVLTTDPKPRLWPMAQQRTVNDFGLYVHCPDYDVSEFVVFDLSECLEIADVVGERLAEGYSKRACFFGLLSDLKKAKKEPQAAIHKEQALRTLRNSPAFLPGLLIAGAKSESIAESGVYGAQPKPELSSEISRHTGDNSAVQQSLL